MASFNVEMSDGYPKMVHFAATAEEAILRAEKEVNAPIYVPYKQAAQVAKEGTTYRAEGEYLVRISRVTAISVSPLKSVYVGGGWCCVPA